MYVVGRKGFLTISESTDFSRFENGCDILRQVSVMRLDKFNKSDYPELKIGKTVIMLNSSAKFFSDSPDHMKSRLNREAKKVTREMIRLKCGVCGKRLGDLSS